MYFQYKKRDSRLQTSFLSHVINQSIFSCRAICAIYRGLYIKHTFRYSKTFGMFLAPLITYEEM